MDREKAIEIRAKQLWEENGKVEGTMDKYRKQAEKEYKKYQKQVFLWKLNSPFRLLSQIPELLADKGFFCPTPRKGGIRG